MAPSQATAIRFLKRQDDEEKPHGLSISKGDSDLASQKRSGRQPSQLGQQGQDLVTASPIKQKFPLDAKEMCMELLSSVGSGNRVP